MKIVVLGAGAIGSLFGGLMAEAGEEVTLVSRDADHVTAVKTDGLRLVLPDRTLKIDVAAAFPEELSAAAELLLVTTKTYDTETALDGAAAAVGQNTRLLTVQNGLGNAEVLSRYVAQERVLAGMTMWPADFTGPGHVTAPGKGSVVFAPIAAPLETARDIEETMNRAGLAATLDADAELAIWEKAAFNVAMNPLCALSRGTPGTVGAARGGRELAEAIVSECADVASAHGVKLKTANVLDTIELSITQHANHLTSMRQDLDAGRRTEIDALNGAFARKAAEQGVQAPLNEAIAALVRMAEAATH